MGKRETIVAYCRKQIGCDYDTTPSGGVEGKSYNCSFLSTCAYKAAGLSIPHWQGHQNADGSQSDWVYRHGHWVTDPSKLKPGDLVFFSDTGSRKNTNHVGIVSRSGSVPYIIDSTPTRGVVERKLPLSAGFVGGGWPLEKLPATATDVQDYELIKVDMVFVVKSKVASIRKQPRKGAEEVGKYERGQKVIFDRVTFNAGYVWGSYVGLTSGERRYVAIGPTSICEVS